MGGRYQCMTCVYNFKSYCCWHYLHILIGGGGGGGQVVLVGGGGGGGHGGGHGGQGTAVDDL